MSFSTFENLAAIISSFLFILFLKPNLEITYLIQLSLLIFQNNLIGILIVLTQPAFTYSKLTIETLKQGVKYVQS